MWVARTGQRHHREGCRNYRLERVDWARVEEVGDLSHRSFRYQGRLLTPCQHCGGGRGPDAHEREPPAVACPAAEPPPHDDAEPATAAATAATVPPAAAAAAPPAPMSEPTPTAVSADVDDDSSSSSDDDDDDEDGDGGSGGSGSGSRHGGGGGTAADCADADDESKPAEESSAGPRVVPAARPGVVRPPAMAIAALVASQMVHAAVLAVTAARRRRSGS